MKIYDRKMFFERIFGFIVVVLITLALNIFFNYDGYTYVGGLIAVAVSSARMVSISLSQEKLKEYNLKQQLNKIAANRLFGNRVKLYSRAVLILCVLMLAALVLDKLLLSVALLAVLVVYSMWYSAVIEKEANKIRAEMELTEE